MASFPYFYGVKHEGAGYFLDELEMAFLISGRDDDEVKLRAFPLVLREEAKTWFLGLPEARKNNWETLKETFLARYANTSSPEKLWEKIDSLEASDLRIIRCVRDPFPKAMERMGSQFTGGRESS